MAQIQLKYVGRPLSLDIERQTQRYITLSTQTKTTQIVNHNTTRHKRKRQSRDTKLNPRVSVGSRGILLNVRKAREKPRRGKQKGWFENKATSMAGGGSKIQTDKAWYFERHRRSTVFRTATTSLACLLSRKRRGAWLRDL